MEKKEQSIVHRHLWLANMVTGRPVEDYMGAYTLQ